MKHAINARTFLLQIAIKWCKILQKGLSRNINLRKLLWHVVNKTVVYELIYLKVCFILSKFIMKTALNESKGKIVSFLLSNTPQISWKFISDTLLKDCLKTISRQKESGIVVKPPTFLRNSCSEEVKVFLGWPDLFKETIGINYPTTWWVPRELTGLEL